MADTPVSPNAPQRRLALGLGLAVAVVAVVFPLMPESVRPWNFAMFGAIGLFVAARVGLLPALGITLGAKLAFDLLNWLTHGQNPDHLPYATVYATYSLYALIGWLMLRHSESPVRIGLTSLGASVVFFLASNFVSWIKQDLPYGYSLAGLGDCYVNAIPFYRGTILGDMFFSAVLFGAYALLSHATAAKPVAERGASRRVVID